MLKREIFSTNGAEVMGYSYEKKTKTESQPLPKIYLRWIIDLNLKVETINILEVDIRDDLHDQG